MKLIPLFAASLILACLTAPAPAAAPGAPPANARNDAWEVIGPGGGGSMYHPTISPHDPNVVLVGCDMTGAYLTKDGGKSWRMINLRGVAQFFVFDPSNANTIYIYSMGLWRSTDAGATWVLVHPNPKSVTGIAMLDDHAEAEFRTTGEAEAITALAVDPKNSQALYAVFTAKDGPSLRRSADAGRTWARGAAGLPAGSKQVIVDNVASGLPAGAEHIYIDPDSPPAQRTVYVVGRNSVAVVEGGVLRQGATAPEPFVDASAGFPGQGAKAVIYGVARGAVYVSRDGGAAWQRQAPGGQLQAVATSLFHPNVAYVSFNGKHELLSQSFGVTKTEDFGATWHAVWSETGKKSPDVDDGWISERFSPGWGDNPIGLGVSATKPEICYSTDSGRTLRSLDGGATWKAAYTRRVAGGGYTTTGLDVTTDYGVHFDPFDAQHLFIDYTDIGLFASADGGASWSSATTGGVPRRWVNTTYWLVFDPAVRGRVWAVMSGTHDLPRPKMWRRGSPSNYQGGVVRSDDGGRSWAAMTNGLPPTAATHILLDARSQPEARVLYVAAFGRGVYRSRDGGQSWEAKNNGLPAHEPLAWRLTQASDGVLYVILARRSEDGSIGKDGDGALYRSKDSGENWEQVPLPAGVNGPNGLAIDPADANRLYLAAWRRRTEDPEAGGGIYLSTDAGATWKQVLARDQHVYDVTIDPRDKNVLYACGFESSAWRSTDRGASWQRIRGYNFKWGHRVIPDPRDASKIYITTFGGSVWHGPAAGDPKAAEDIATPVAAYSK
jgi:photosystem II stability/assembly factor-like uncharacterized protein